MYQSTITKEDLALLPKLTFEGKITIVDTPKELDKAIRVLEKEKTVGFDTETKPSFVKGGTPNQVALMQFSTLKECYLIRLNKLGIPLQLDNFLNNPSVKKIGISLKDDFHSLRRRQNIKTSGFIDIQVIISKYGIEEKSLQKIYAIMFGKRISKSQRLSNWEADVLTTAQQEYAAIDAVSCLEIYNKLINPL
jgi:ribonuclease D